MLLLVSMTILMMMIMIMIIFNPQPVLLLLLLPPPPIIIIIIIIIIIFCRASDEIYNNRKLCTFFLYRLFHCVYYIKRQQSSFWFQSNTTIYFILYLSWRNVSTVNWLKPETVLMSFRELCTAWSDGGQNCSPANALRADSPVCHLSWRRCGQFRRWLSWVWCFCFQPTSLHSPSLACRSNPYTKWQPFIALLTTITVLETCIFPVLLPIIVPTWRRCEICLIDVRKH